jgi:IS30 family transposase
MIDEKLVAEIAQRGRRRRTKQERVAELKEEILELRKRGLSLAQICLYLSKRYRLKVSPKTLVKAVPELRSAPAKERLLGDIKRFLFSLSSPEELGEFVKELNLLIKELRQAKGWVSSDSSSH